MSLRYVQISVNVPRISGVFDYHLPEALTDQVQAGCLVEVPFGQQTVQGIVLDEVETPQVAETKPVKALLDPRPVVTRDQIALARWMADHTLSPLSVCVSALLPPGLSKQADTLFHLEPLSETSVSTTQLQNRLIHLLKQRGDLRGRQIDSRLPGVNWRAAARGLVQRGFLTAQPILPQPSVRPKVVRTVQLTASPEEVSAQWDSLGQRGALERRQLIMDFLLREPWEVEVAWIYAHSPGANLNDLRRLAEMGLIRLGETEIWRDPLDDLHWDLQTPPKLTDQQQGVWGEVETMLGEANRGKQPKPILLQGVTGSGKTEIYLRAVAETLKQGRGAVILTPEISLTPQTVKRFAARFPGKVGLVHSRLSAGERYDTWRRVRAGLLRVVVGARSALFSPIPNLGLIVIDEFHDSSYYQRSSTLSYHTIELALAYARQCGAACILGSATPDIGIRYRAERRGWPILRLPDRILAHRETVNAHLRQLGSTIHMDGAGDTSVNVLPPVEVIDLRDELKLGNRSIFSFALQNALREVLAREQQAILFLNRRGSATYVFCRDCGFVIRCPNCDKPLTYHAEGSDLLCHTCAHHQPMPAQCPACGGPNVRQYGTGTEKVEAYVHDLFPDARVLRYDFETTRQKGAHDIILSHFANHRADILIGTQMLTKGLDLPLVTLVGVVLADVGLNLPDFRTNERVFQLLTQVAGRAGRSPLGGRVILQTFDPDHYVIQHAAEHDFEGFYREELNRRRDLAYPPFTQMMRLEFRDRSAETARRQAEETAREIRAWIEEGEHIATRMIGPVPCFFSRLNRYYRWQIVLVGPDPSLILRNRELNAWQIEFNPPSLL
ncbi:MAG: primosomal protein N' [Anaerolineaceae bacterium]|nr:primosomal protein N' [Anaerolineaceae bacterium]